MDSLLTQVQRSLAEVPNPLAFLAGIFAHVPVGLQVYRADGRCVLVNSAFIALFGSEPPPEYNVLNDEIAEAQGVLDLIRRAFTGETVVVPTIWYDARELKQVSVPEGRRVAIAATIFPLRDGSGQVTHVALVFKDETAERTARDEAERERDLLRLVIEQTGDGVIVSDETGRLSILNPEAERQHGVRFAAAAAPEWSARFGLRSLEGEPLPLEVTPLYRALHGEHVRGALWRVRAPDGQERVLSGTATPLRATDGRSIGAVLTTRDETARLALEEELARSRDQLRIVLAGVADGITAQGPDGKLVFANAAAARILGYDSPEALAAAEPGAWRQFYEVFDEDGRIVQNDQLPTRRALAGDPTPEVLLRQRRLATGEDRWVMVRSSPARDVSGHTLLGITIFHDITERKRAADGQARLHAEVQTSRADAERARARLHALFLAAPVAIAIQRGPEHVWELANDAYRALLGNQEIAGKRRIDVLPDMARISHILDEVYRTGETFRREEFPLKVQRAGDGAWEPGWFSFVCQPTHDSGGAVDGVITCAIEVTSQVDARHEVEALARELEQAVQVRDGFLQIASHELKTPLTTLQLHADSLVRALERNEPLPPERIADRLRAILGQALRLQRLIGELLDVSRISMGPSHLDLRRETVDLRALVHQAVARLGEDSLRARSTLDVHADVAVMGLWDPLRIDQVVTNLLANALKYGAGKPIEVSVSLQSGSARLEVRDHGIGIDAVDQQRIFERFERAVSTRHYGGFGLGLWITRQIVEAHGGTIGVVSERGEGARFTVELPLAPIER